MSDLLKDVDESESSEEVRSLRGPVILLTGFLVAVALALWIFYGRTPAEETTQVFEAAAPSSPVDEQQETNLHFREVARERGLDFLHVNGSDGRKLLPETMGSGAAFLDFDQDGDQDLVLVNGRSWSDTGGKTGAVQAFYVNEGGHFINRTAEVGLDISLYGMGAAVGDYNGDGFPDLFLTAVGRNILLRNENGKRFVDVSQEAGVSGAGKWSTGAAFFDHDQDGDLDLMVLNYVTWSPELDLSQDFSLGSLERAFGPPTSFAGDQPFFYENLGNGRFREVAAKIGLHVRNKSTGVAVGKSLGLVVTDLDRDGRPDVVVANDTVRNFVFHNLGGRFEEIGMDMGLAFDENGNARGAMGIDSTWFRGGQSVAIAIANFANEMTAFYVNDDPADPLFIDEATSVGIGAPSRDVLSFGLMFGDLDLNGTADLVVANGHVEPDIARVQPSQSHGQPLDVFLGRKGRFQRLKDPALQERFVGRGLALADIDGDGDLDILATANGDRPRLFLNELEGGCSLRLDLRLKDKRRLALGAEVTLHQGSDIVRQNLRSGGSYLSCSEAILTFGLGNAEVAEKITVRWPDGRVSTHRGLKKGLHILIQP